MQRQINPNLALPSAGMILFLLAMFYISFAQSDISYLDLAVEVGRMGDSLSPKFENFHLRNQLQKNLDGLEKRLTNYHKDTSNAVRNMATKTKVRDMMFTLNTALPKFTSDDPLMKLSGVADLMMGVGMFAGPPAGFIIAAFGGILSIAFRMFSSKDVDGGVGALIRSAVTEGFDQDLLAAMNGVKKRLTESKIKIQYYSQNITAKNISKENLQILVPFVEDTKTVLMGKIEHRIQRGAKTYPEAHLLMKIITVYAYLIEIRSFILLELQKFVRQTGVMPAKPGEIELIRFLNLDDYKQTLRFLGQPDCIKTNVSKCESKKNYPIMHAYYPIEKNKEFQNIENVMRMISLPTYEISYPKIGVKYRLIPNEYPGWSFYGYSIAIDSPLGFDIQSYPKVSEWMTGKPWVFKKDLNGYYNIYSYGFRRVTNSYLHAGRHSKDLEYYEQWHGKEIDDYASFSLIPANRDGSRFLIGVKAYPGYSLRMNWNTMNFALEVDNLDEAVWKLEEV